MSGSEDRGATLDNSRNMGPEMDLVNRSNPWLPAYGFQIQHHHANFQPTHEDLRANDTMLVQQVDFLETILEETSDDLQSDSDRSGTTYWLGSDSETESVIHIKTNQRTADEKQDGSGSDCNSVVPKKRRRKNGSDSLQQQHQGSPRSSRDSSTSSRSSSLLQFESLERTCATLSPSSYSFDSLEYQRAGGGAAGTANPVSATVTSNGSGGARHDPASPDSLEQEDYGQLNGGAYHLADLLPRDSGDSLFGRLRPYRSFESLGEKDLAPREPQIGGLLTNGFASHAFGKNCDLSRLARRLRSRRRNPWQLNDTDGYSDYEDSSDNLSSPENEDEDDDDHDYSTRYNEVDQLLVFGEQCSAYSHTASLDCRNSVDLRDFGLDSDDEEKRRENTFLDLKAAARLSLPGIASSQDYASLNDLDEDEDEDDLAIEPGVQLRRRHHHHHKSSPSQQQQQPQHPQPQSSFTQQQQHHHHHRHRGSGSLSLQYGEARLSGSGAAGNSGTGANGGGSGFNFRFADTWRSAPSLPGSLLESAALAATSSSASLLPDEKYTRVASVPVDLDLCGRHCTSSTATTTTRDDELPDDEPEPLNAVLEEKSLSRAQSKLPELDAMADVMRMSNHDDLAQEEDIEPGKTIGEEKARLRKRVKELSSSIKIQDSQSSELLSSLSSEGSIPLIDGDKSPSSSSSMEKVSTVKTQDPLESNVLGLAMAIENNVDAAVDEAIRQLRREVEEATDNIVAATSDKELVASAGSPVLCKQSRNNASYELAQQWSFDEKAVEELRRRGVVAPTKPLRHMNNASYELAQQNDVLRDMSMSFEVPPSLLEASFEEVPEPELVTDVAAFEKIEELVEEMRGGRVAGGHVAGACSTSNLASDSRREYLPDARVYSKSTENVSASRRQPKQSPPPLSKSPVGGSSKQLIETSLLDRLKKNSDLFSSTGEGPGRAGAAEALATPLPATPNSCVLGLDDEVDYPCLLENKPLVPASNETIQANDGATTTTTTKTTENATFHDDEVELVFGCDGKRSYIGEYYPERAFKSCEDVRAGDSGGSFRGNERLWRVVVEKESSRAGGGDGTAAARRLVYPPPPAGESAARGVGSAAAAAAGGDGGLSSPATVAERDNAATSNASLVSLVDEQSQPYDEEEEEEEEPREEAGTVPQPRAAEMSATAAKRLAMSGEPTTYRSTSSMNTLNTSSSSVREEKKKGGLGGFLQRFSKLRFSGRSKVPRSELQKKSSSASAGARGGVGGASSANVQPKRAEQQANAAGKKKEPDYIIIPLHPPEEERRQENHSEPMDQRNNALPSASLNGRPPVCSSKKPPLPPQSLRTSSGAGSGGGGGGYTSGYGFGGVTGVGVSGSSRRRAATDLGNPAAIEMAKARAAMLASQDHPPQQPRHHQYHPHPHHPQHQQQQQPRPVGLLETDLDAPVDPEEAAGKKARSLLNLNHHHNGHPPHLHHPHHLHQQQAPALSIAGPEQLEDRPDDDYEDEQDDSRACCRAAAAAAAVSNHHHHHHHHRAKQVAEAAAGHQRPHKSMEFLLDKENLHFVKPPENELQKVGERTPSEHELRVQRSLQRLNVPDWYKNSPAARDGGGFRLKRHSDASQHGGWRALGSKTTSLSSLSSSSNRQPTTGLNLTNEDRTKEQCVLEGTLLSPSPTPPVFSRWSTSLLNSAGSSPASSARSSFNHRQPYLGWRSQERLANPRTPAERLAQGILPQLQNANKQQQQQQQSPQQQPQSGQPGQTTNQEVRNSIKEVTSAIVHYVQSGQEVVGGGGGGRLSPRPRDDSYDRGGARSTSPRGSTRLVWMESSFVGVRPVESPPETPAGIAITSPGRPSLGGGSPSRSSLLDSTSATTTTPGGCFAGPGPGGLTLASLRSGGYGGGGGETSEDGSTPGLCPDDGGFVSLSGGSTTELAATPVPSLASTGAGGSQLFLDLLGQQSPREAETGAGPGPALPPDHRHRQRRHRRATNDSDSGSQQRRERRESPSPTLLQQQDGSSRQQQQHHHQSRQRQRAEPEQHPHRQQHPHQQPHEQQLQQQQHQQQQHQRDGSCQPRAQSTDSQQHQPRTRPPLQRRRSEGSDLLPTGGRSSSRSGQPHHPHKHHHHHHHQQHRHRRVSFDSASSLENLNQQQNRDERVVRCRNSKCNNSATMAEARRSYKSCHNCTCLYCSRECRRAHWQRHRRTCLYSRASSLCVQVLSSLKKDPSTLKHVSILARRGFATHGRGAVKCFFASPEAAEKFIQAGFLELGEPSYVRWSDILPSEMGAELYAEAVRLCEAYNPDTRLVVYVSVCVVREVPSSTGAVMWERQPVSRCAKLKLEASCRAEAKGATVTTSSSTSAIEQQQQQQAPQQQQQQPQPQQQAPTTPREQCNITREMESPETLVLTSTPAEAGASADKSQRELCFANVQRQLKQRGVSLRRHFPQMYTKLCAYADGSADKLAPMTIYPRDQTTGRSFACIIMLDAEPERLQLLPTDSSRVKTVDVSVEIPE